MKKISWQMWKYLLAGFMGRFGSSMFGFALGFFVLKQTGSALGMGVTLITGPLVSLVLTPFVGYVVDTMNHRRVILICQVMSMVMLVVFGLVYRIWPAQYYIEIIGLMIVLQISDNFFSTAISASMIHLFDETELQKVNSLSMSITSTAGFLAPIIGAIVYAWVSIDVFAFIEVAFEFIALAGFLMLNFNRTTVASEENMVEQPTEVEPKEGIFQNFKSGFSYLRTQPLVAFIMVIAAGVNLFFASQNVGMPFLLVDTLKITSQPYGVIMSASAIGMFLGGLIFSSLKIKTHIVKLTVRNLMVMSTMLIVIAIPEFMGWPILGNTIFYFIYNLLEGMLLVFINTPIGVFAQQTIAPKYQGRVFSMLGTLATLLMPVGTLIFGALFDISGAFWIFVSTSIAMFVLLVVGTIYLKRTHLIEQDEEKKKKAESEQIAATENLVVE